jgi:hypothetical protein
MKYRPKKQNEIKLKSYIDKENERNSKRKRRCNRVK